MNVLIGPLALPAGDFHVTRGSENPGIGGTEHMGLQLASLLSRRKGVSVAVGVWGSGRKVSGNGETIDVIDLTKPGTAAPFDVCVSPVWQAERLVTLHPEMQPDRLTLWSHHPHDRHLVRLCKNGVAHRAVSVGGYQYFSNNACGAEHHWIPNPYPYWAERTTRPPLHERPSVVGHVGAIVRAKGFHRIARHWADAQKRMPEYRLQVLGSGSLYGPLLEPDPLIPTDLTYGEIIRRAFGGRNLPDSVSFEGVVESKAAYIGHWRCAVQNLTGGSEAMPASVQELLVHGVPVIGSRNFGMWDFMADFPELCVSHPRQYPERLLALNSSPSLAEEILGRCQVMADRWRQFDENELADAWLTSLDRAPDWKGSTPQSPPLPQVSRRLERRARLQGAVERLRDAVHRLTPLAVRVVRKLGW